jgi:DNA-binding response OmpR family regulator
MPTICLVGHPAKGRLTGVLQAAGYYSLSRKDADRALIVLSAVRADVFVIDVGNPTVGGERLLERLRAVNAGRRIPVFLTGARYAQYQQLAQRVGVGDVMLVGEGSANRVLARVRQLLRKRRADVGYV